MPKDEFTKGSDGSQKPLTPGYTQSEGENHFHDDDGTLMIDFGGEAPKDRQEYFKKASNEVLDHSTVDLGSGWPKEMVWTTKDKRRIPIPQMADSHLLNTIAYIRRREPTYKKQVLAKILKGFLQLAAFNMFMVDPEDDWIYEEHNMHDRLSQAKDFIAQKGRDVLNQDSEEFLRQYIPQFPYLLQEAYRRKLLIDIDHKTIT